MTNKHANDFDQLITEYRKLRPLLMSKAGTMAVTFFKENFRRQGFLDRTLERWHDRIPGTPGVKGKPIEIRRGILRRGVQKKSVRPTQAIVGVDPAIKYAEIQNNGGKIPITNKMRRFFWAMYYQANSGKEHNANGKERNNQRNKTLNEAATFWKNLALTKKTHLEIKARKFIGDSATLEAEMFEMFDTEIFKLFNK